MSMLSEFKDFAMRGNVVDLAVGVIIGGAFGKIVSALVDKIMMPVIGFLSGGVDFAKQSYPLVTEVIVDGKVTTAGVNIGYGEFINALIQFMIIACCLFLVIKAMNSIPLVDFIDHQSSTQVQIMNECSQVRTRV